MSKAHDRVSGRPGAPESGWTGRWADGSTHVLDLDGSTAGRDGSDSDDLTALLSIARELETATRSRSWLALAEAPLLARHDDDTLELRPSERVLQEHIASIAHVCERFVTRLNQRSELLPVARVKRPARKALERLSAHTEDWAGRTLSGPVPRRAMAVTREEDADLYENRMVSELVHPILTTALDERIRWLKRLGADLAELQSAKDVGTHHRRTRLYTFWGADAQRAAESANRASDTLRTLEGLVAWIQALRGSTLASILRGRRTGHRALRHTNVIANDRHYHAAGLVWSAHEREPIADESPEQRRSRFLSRHRAFDDYVLGLVVRALDGHGYFPDADELPMLDHPVVTNGPWGSASLARNLDGTLIVSSHGRSTRFVPLVDLVSPDDDHPTTVRRWESVAAQAGGDTVVVFLGDGSAIARLPHPHSMVMSSAGHDAKDSNGPVGVPVSPLATTSLERVARAIADAVLTPALLEFPVGIRLGDDRLPRRLIEHLASAQITAPGLSPLFYRDGVDGLALRRPLAAGEIAKLETVIRELTDRTHSPGWERDLETEIGNLRAAVDTAATTIGRLLVCPICGTTADVASAKREGDIVVIGCDSCKARWGHERCGQCRGRIPFIETGRELQDVEVVGPGWVERIYGQDALASPCWARTVAGRYICTNCRNCSVEPSPEGANCVRCHAGAAVIAIPPQASGSLAT